MPTRLPGPVVSTPWLAEHAASVRIVDVRSYLDGRSGHDAYLGGHLPGAVWLNLDVDLSAPATAEDGRHPLPSPEHFAAALGQVGIGESDVVVAYDDAGGSIASRLWWMLHVLGSPVALLDGGLAAWEGPLVTEVPEPAPVERPARSWPTARFRTADQIADAPVVIDARTEARYRHGDDAIDPRPGHIPGAHSRPWAGNLDEHGRFRSPGELRDRFATLSPGPVVAYCGSGVTACHDLLALHLAGRDDTALYPGSWSQWGADPSRPAETG